MRTWIVFMCAAATVGLVAETAARQNVAAQDLVIRDAWVREATVGQASSAAYCVVENKSAVATAITSVSVPFAATAELHTMKMSGGMNGQPEMMSMEKVNAIDVPAKGSVELKPGGFHVMVFKVSQALVPGQTVPITLGFRGGATKTVTATVRARAATNGMAH